MLSYFPVFMMKTKMCQHVFLYCLMTIAIYMKNEFLMQVFFAENIIIHLGTYPLQPRCFGIYYALHAPQK